MKARRSRRLAKMGKAGVQVAERKRASRDEDDDVGREGLDEWVVMTTMCAFRLKTRSVGRFAYASFMCRVESLFCYLL